MSNKSLLIDIAKESYLFKHGFFDDNILTLKVDGREEYAVFVNENKYEGDLNLIEKVNQFLKGKYSKPSINTGNEDKEGFIDKEAELSIIIKSG